MSEAKLERKPDSPLVSIVINVVVPVAILTLLSKEKYLGPVWALVVGLLFPIGYGLRTLIRDRKPDIMSIIGIVSVTLTGVFGILELPPEWIARKEAAIPLLMGLAIVGSLKTPFPFSSTSRALLAARWRKLFLSCAGQSMFGHRVTASPCSRRVSASQTGQRSGRR